MYKVGDLVCIKSGGPAMTVSATGIEAPSLQDQNLVEVIWMSVRGELQFAAIRVDCLEKLVPCEHGQLSNVNAGNAGAN